ncbi:MAG: hypothetical protein ACKPCP_20365, partial [Sphaerospermopsis kisseleviana]
MTHSYIEERNQVVEQLLSLGLAPLPVVPKQDGAIFTGKNPSYFDSNGRPHLLNHSKYQHTLPTESEIALWFSDPLTGIGTLGTESVTWIDIDSNKVASQQACDRAYQQLLESHQILNTAWLERTQSGGYRIGVRLNTSKDFTNFKLFGDGDHVGECLGRGRFTVLAPTV